MLQPEGLGPVSRFWTANRLRLHYLDWGNADAPLLVLIHGAEDHARSWDRIARELRRDWHVIAPDLRGHGDSDWSPDGAYLLPYLAYDLAELIEGQGAAPAAIVAHSLGAAIGLRHAGLFPDRVDRIVAIEGLGPAPAKLAERAAVPVGTRWLDWIAQRRRFAARPPRRFETVEAALARMEARFPRLPAELLRHLTEHNLRRGEGGGYSWKFDPLVRSRGIEEVDERDLHAFWQRVSCPTLLVYGADSWASNPAEDGRADYFSKARTVVIPDAGHWLQHDQHDRFMAEVRPFLAAAPGALA